MYIEDRIASDQQRVCLVLRERRKCAFDSLPVAGFHNAKPEGERVRRRAHVGRLSLPLRGVGIDQGSKSGRVRNKFAEQSKPLRCEVCGNDRHSVALPSGRERLEASPNPTGSPPITNTIGIADVALFATSAELDPPTATRTATGPRTRSAALCGRRSNWPSAKQY